MSALSDSYLPSMGLDDNHTHPHLQGATSGAPGGGAGAGGTMLNPMPHMGDNILSPEEEALFPPTLSAQDRHPSALQLASMLSSSASVDNGGKVPADVMMGEEVRVCVCVCVMQCFIQREANLDFYPQLLLTLLYSSNPSGIDQFIHVYAF